MQTLDVISVNIWNIIISLLNLLILFMIVKKFLYKPVNKVLKERREQIDGNYHKAEIAKEEAMKNKTEWEDKLKGAKGEAENILKNAKENASLRSEKLILEAKTEADDILRRAKENAELEKKKAEEEIKREIADVSVLLAEKMLEREINEKDHHATINSFIERIGDEDDANE